MTTVNIAEMYRTYKAEDEITVLPEGEYLLTVFRASTRKGNKGPIINLVYKVAEGPSRGKSVMGGPLTLSDASRQIFFRQLAGFGLKEDFLQQAFTTPDPIRTIADSLVGRTVQAKLGIDPWNGEDRNKVAIGGLKLISVPDGVAPQPQAGVGGAVTAPPAAPPQQQAPPPPPPAPSAGPSSW